MNKFFYIVATGKMGKTHHIHGNTTCNGLMPYSGLHALARRYADDAKSGEEPAFVTKTLANCFINQGYIPDIRSDMAASFCQDTIERHF